MSFTDFEFNGQKLSDFGCILCSFNGGSGIKTVSIGSNLSLNTINRPRLNKFKILSTKYDEPFSATFQICKNECGYFINEKRFMTENEVSKIMRWLNKKSYRKFKMIYSDGKCSNMYFRGTFSSIQMVTLGENIIGLELSFQADASFGYYEPLDFDMDFSDINDEFSIYDNSDEIGYIYPRVLQITVLEDGDLEIKNSQEEESVIIKNCVEGEIITLDGENKIIISNKSHPTLYNDFNYNFVKIINKCGDSDDYYEVDNEDDQIENIFSVTLPCTIHLSYSPICKMGVI
ncbi:MAG: hypothetical protein IJA10_10155 [Lachnospiraceae bacterium]|nr:hypothetical protein [Lachnospiraceae bacterium]